MEATVESCSHKGRAEVVGSPGAGARNWGVWQLLAPLFVLVLIVGFVAGAALRPEFLRDGFAGVVLLMLVAALVVLFRLGGARLSRHMQGARGEEVVAMHLASLSGSWTVFHSVPLDGKDGGRDADHVVVSSRGIFLVETLHWQGRVHVAENEVILNGRQVEFDPFPKARARAASLVDSLHQAEGIRVEVTPVLCFVGSGVAAGSRDGISFMDEQELVAFLEHADVPETGASLAAKVIEMLKAGLDDGAGISS